MNGLLDWCKTQYTNIKTKVNDTLNTAFPDTSKKRFFLIGLGLIEVLLAYIIACLDIGIWQSDCSLSGMVAGYWMHDRSYPVLMLLLLGGGLLVGIYFYLASVNNGNTGRGFSISSSNVYGSARDINLDELKQVADIATKEEATGTIYGQLDQSETKLVTAKNLSNYNRNFLALAPPGAGKTFCLVLPFIAQAIKRSESCVVTDTKGEVWAKTVELARRNGYIVKRIDFKNPQCSDGWDILAEIRMDDIRAKTIAQIIMENTGNPKDIHKSAEEALLTAVCLYTALNPDSAPEERTLYNAYAMLFSGANALDYTFKIIKDDPNMRVAYDYYATFVQGSENLRGNIITNLANRLSVLSSPAIRELTSTPDVDLSLPGKKKCIYYVELNDQVNSQRFLSSLFFSFIFWDLCDFADAQPDQKLPIYVNILIEEAFACGYLPTITNAMATVRSRAMGVGLIAQGVEQFRILYGPETTETILNCCATQLCLGTNAESTADLFEWLSGTATVKVKTEQHTVGEGPLHFGRRYSTGDGRQALYSGNDVRKIGFGRILCVFSRFDPIMLHTFGINRHPEFLNGHMPQISGVTKVPLLDREAKAYLKAREEERVAQFDAWLAQGNDPWKDGKHQATRPEFIPYPDLEEEALAHSQQARVEEDAALMQELQSLDPIAPAEEYDTYCIPEMVIWEEYENELKEEPEKTTEDGPSEEYTWTAQAVPQKTNAPAAVKEEPPEKHEPIVLDAPDTTLTLAGIGTPNAGIPPTHKTQTANDKVFGGGKKLTRKQ